MARSAAATRLEVTPPPVQKSSPITSRIEIVFSLDCDAAMMPAFHLSIASASGSKAQIDGRRSAFNSGSLRRLIAVSFRLWCGLHLRQRIRVERLLREILDLSDFLVVHPWLMTSGTQRLCKEFGLVLNRAIEKRTNVELRFIDLGFVFGQE